VSVFSVTEQRCADPEILTSLQIFTEIDDDKLENWNFNIVWKQILQHCWKPSHAPLC